MEVKVSNFGEVNGKKVSLFTIVNKHGNSIAVTNYGATWVSAVVPDGKGNKDDVLLGFSDLKGYIEDTCYIGSTVGRYANRIENAAFELDGKVYKITTDGTKHSLHGGAEGFSSRVWDSEVEDDGVTFGLVSPDGDQGFPGELKVRVRYRWDDNNVARIEFFARTNKPTPVSLTNHAYFNLRGNGTILDHRMKIHADAYLPMKEDCIGIGKPHCVEGTPFDFRETKTIGADINNPHEQLIMCNGYDESFLFKEIDDNLPMKFAEIYDPETGRGMIMSSTYMSMHLYTANFLTSSNPGKKGVEYGQREAFCLEAQYPPNMPNFKTWASYPDCILRPGETYNHTIECNFTTL